MESHSDNTQAARFFRTITGFPKTILATAVSLIICSASFLPQLTKDTRSEAFIPSHDPVLQYRDKVKETFGLRDPMVVAVTNDGPSGVFTPQSLQLVKWLTDQIAKVPGIDPERGNQSRH